MHALHLQQSFFRSYFGPPPAARRQRRMHMILRNARIRTMEGADIDCGYVRVADGRIQAAGPLCQCPAPEPGEELLELGGKRQVLPGFIDAHSHLGLFESGLGIEGDDINEDTDPVTPHLRALDGVNPLDPCFEEARRGGVTCAVVSPGSANPLAGQICALKTWGRRVDDMAAAPALAMKFALGENPKMSYGGKTQAPATRMATAALIREQLAKASRYLQDCRRADMDSDFDKPEYDAKCEALLPLLEGKMQAHFHAHRAYDILTAVRIAGEFGFPCVIIHCTEGHLIADILRDAGASAICGPLVGARTKPELANLSPRGCAALVEAGVPTAISTDHPELPVDFLAASAAVAVAGGLDAGQALRTITIDAARVLGLDRRLGSIAPGKDADLLVFGADPLSGHNKPEMVFINGSRRI